LQNRISSSKGRRNIEKKMLEEVTTPILDDTGMDKTAVVAEFRNKMQNRLVRVSMGIYGKIILRAMLRK
jgi:hypothetical protein